MLAERGVEQGDPWGLFLFALGFINALLAGSAWLEENGFRGMVMALMDGLNIVAPLLALPRTISSLLCYI